MPNTTSAKKAVRGSKRKKQHNLLWKGNFKDSIKDLKTSIAEKESNESLTDKLHLLQKALDKASKEKVIHKNKANRLKSIYARKVSALSKPKSAEGSTKHATKSKPRK